MPIASVVSVGARNTAANARMMGLIPLRAQPTQRKLEMLYTIAVVLLVLWAFGLVSAYTMGGFIHVLLVIAVVVVLLRVISGRKPI